MRREIVVSDIRFTPAGRALRETGLIGWVVYTLDGHVDIHDSTVRLTRAGQYAVAFPVKTKDNGVHYPIVRPLSPAVRADIERQILDDLRRQGIIE